MCIVLFSTAHPEYSLILIANRDEYLNRPTARAGWWPPPYPNVLGGRDLLYDTHGTWLALARDGRIGVITNILEENVHNISGIKSRGDVVTQFVTGSLKNQPHQKKIIEEGKVHISVTSTDQITEDFLQDVLVKHCSEYGGFNLLFGHAHPSKPHIALISNKLPGTRSVMSLTESARGTFAVSNAMLGDYSWPKVTDGQNLLAKAVQESLNSEEQEPALVKRLFHVLHNDALTSTLRDKSNHPSQHEIMIKELKKTIFVPALNGDGRLAGRPEAGARVSGDDTYGTQKQTIILVSKDGSAVLIERTLYENGISLGLEGEEVRFGFVLG